MNQGNCSVYHPSVLFVISIYVAVTLITSISIAVAKIYGAWEAYISPADAEFMESLGGHNGCSFEKVGSLTAFQYRIDIAVENYESSYRNHCSGSHRLNYK